MNIIRRGGIFLILSAFFFIIQACVVTGSGTENDGILKETLKIIEEKSLRPINMTACAPFFKEELRKALNNSEPNKGKPESECFDKYSSFLSPEEMREMDENLNGNFGGIGAMLKELKDDNNTRTIIDSVIPGKPAERAGLKAGDIIIAVREEDVAEAVTVGNVSDAIKKLRGNIGTTIFVTVKRADENLTFLVVREKIEISPVSFKKLPSGVGYISVPGHNEKTADDFEIALRSFSGNGKDIPRVIVDLRNNPGGTLDSPLEMLFYFSKNPEDIALTTRERGSEMIYTIGNMNGMFINQETGENKIPGEFKDYVVVLLVNENTASAAEIFSGTMQDWGNTRGHRFVVLGTTSYKKGVGQQIFSLPKGAGLTLTTFEFFVGNEQRAVNKIGVLPTVEVPDTREKASDTLTEKDYQFLVAEEISRFIKAEIE